MDAPLRTVTVEVKLALDTTFHTAEGIENMLAPGGLPRLVKRFATPRW